MIPGSSDVENKARSALLASPVHALHDLTVTRVDDALLISGTVTSFYHKQLAQEAIRPFVEDLRVVNSIDVDYHSFG